MTPGIKVITNKDKCWIEMQKQNAEMKQRLIVQDKAIKHLQLKLLAIQKIIKEK